MKVLLDTSVLYPALTFDHAHHELCKTLIEQLRQKDDIVVLNTHVVAELYSTMTSHPKLKITPTLARDTLTLYTELFTEVSLTMEDYRLAMDRCAELDLSSGIIYDALHFQAAIKSKVEVLYTANIRHFSRLMTDEITFRLASPLE